MGARDVNNFSEAIQRVVEGEAESIPAEDSPEDIKITPPQEPQVNPAVYRDVEAILFYGFLTLYADVNGVPFVFKSMNHHEFNRLQWIHGPYESISGKAIERYYNSFIAHGVFMVDGQNVLVDRDHWVPELADTFSLLPAIARSKIIRYLGEVNRKAANAVTLTEAYVMEQASRFRWAQIKGLDLMSPTCTGVPGTDKLGLNYAQLVWRALNHFEDLRDEAEREWDHAKFIGSCFAGKEIRKIYNQDRDRRQKEREQRLERRDKLFRQVFLGESPDKNDKTGGALKIVARSVDELATQLERDLRGEKDWHDEVVAAHEARIRDQIQERRAQIQDLAKAKELTQGSRQANAHTEIVGLSPQEVQERILRRRQLAAQQAASQVVYPELSDPRIEDFMQRYGMEEETSQRGSGVTVSVGRTDRDTSSVVSLPPSRPRTAPFRR